MFLCNVTRLGDLSSGHEHCYTPSPLVTASPNVYINGIPCGREGDHYETHGGCETLHHAPDTDYLISQHNVLVNGKSIAAVGDLTDNGSTAAEGSPNVFLVRR